MIVSYICHLLHKVHVILQIGYDIFMSLLGNLVYFFFIYIWPYLSFAPFSCSFSGRQSFQITSTALKFDSRFFFSFWVCNLMTLILCRKKHSLKRRLRIRTMQFGVAHSINEMYDTVDPEVVLSLLVHKVFFFWFCYLFTKWSFGKVFHLILTV